MAKSVTAKTGSTDPSPGLVLLCAVCYLVCVFLSRSWAGLLSLTVIGVVTQLLLGIKLRELLCDLRQSWLLLLLTCVVHWAINSHYLGSNDDKLIYYFSIDQAEVSIRFTLRLALILTVLGSLSRLHEMQRYGRSFGRIFSFLPFGARFFSRIELIATLSLRMIPFIQQQYSRLDLGLEARGEKKTQGLLGQILRLKRLLFPLMVQSIRRADKTAIALQVRGYDPAVERTLFHEFTVTRNAQLLALIFVVISAVTLFI